MRLCNLYLLLLGLHGISAHLAGAWQHQEGSIVRQLLMPELVFWQTVTHKASKASFDPGVIQVRIQSPQCCSEILR